MGYNPQARRRRSIRLPKYDYSQPGAYFITIVTEGRKGLFGEIHDGIMHLSEAGQIVWEIWNSLPVRYPDVGVGTAQVMPNHFHGIVNILATSDPTVGEIHETPVPDRRRMTLPLVVGYFKMNTAKQINILLGREGVPVWQRNYYEHIIRDENDYHRVHRYIEANVSNWGMDDENQLKAR
ncbi:MAG: transposase [Bacteroidota bacterium]